MCVGETGERLRQSHNTRRPALAFARMVRSGLVNGGWCAHRKMRAQRIVSIIIIIVIVIILIVTTSAVAMLAVMETDNVAVVGHSCHMKPSKLVPTNHIYQQAHSI